MRKTTPAAEPKPATIMIRMPLDLHWQCKAQAAKERIDLATWYARAAARSLAESEDMRTAP